MAKTEKTNRETNDRPVGDSDLTVLQCIREAKREAEQAKRGRMVLNRQNTNAYMGLQNWSHKQAGQSREFLPKTPVAVEQFSAFVKRSLVQFGDWFSVDVPQDFMLKDYEVRELMKCFLDYLADGMRESTSFALRVSDGCKVSLWEAVMTFKVHGFQVPETVYSSQNGGLKRKILKPWRLAIDIVRAEDYFPDPTGRKLYEIHDIESDLHDVIELAEQGLYDINVVDDIVTDYDMRVKEWQDSTTRNEQGISPPSFRKTVKITEYWGDILSEDGHLEGRNMLTAMANDKYLIRPPEKNPYWHGESPFVSFPLIRVPDTVWHKALCDHGSPLNMALNELFNLMLDGGLSSVWGIKQLRSQYLEDPRQITGGIPQGITLAVKDDMPEGMKVLETVSQGEVPPEAMHMFNLADKEFNGAMLSNDLKMGHLPTKEVKATEIVEIQQSQAVTLDGITIDAEMGLSKVLNKAWLTIIQNASHLEAEDIVACIGPRAALSLSRMKPGERYAALGRRYGFKVHGLSSTIARVRDFQKFAAVNQMIQTNPMLMEAFLRRFSPDKNLDWIFKSLNINPDQLGLEPAELADLPNRVNRMAALSQTFGTGQGGGGASVPAASGGDAGLPAEIQQATNPLTGMTG